MPDAAVNTYRSHFASRVMMDHFIITVYRNQCTLKRERCTGQRCKAGVELLRLRIPRLAYISIHRYSSFGLMFFVSPYKKYTAPPLQR